MAVDRHIANQSEATDRQPVPLDRLTIFNHLWAIAGLCEVGRWLRTGDPWCLILLPGSMGLLAFPRSVPWLTFYAASQLCFHALVDHSPWNHGLFLALMNGAIIASVVRIAYLARNLPELATDASRRAALLRLIAPTLCFSLVLMYGFAFLHKLNWDFLDPRYSCVGNLLAWLNLKYRILPSETWFVVVGIGGALFAESGTPLLLCFARTVRWGIALGFGFHLFLSQSGALYGFAAVVYAVYYLFLPSRCTDEIATQADRLRRRYPQLHIDRGFSVAIVLSGVTAVLLLHWATERNAMNIGRWWWNGWLLVVFSYFCRPILRGLKEAERRPLTPAWRPLWIFPLLVVASGMSPYLGLKTETAWAMYSNLRTESPTNHLFMPPALKIFTYQDDLVEIIEASHPQLQRFQEQDLNLPYFEFRRICSRIPGDFRVRYVRGGLVQALVHEDGVSSIPDATRPHSWLLARLLRFRPVDAGPHMRCRH